MEIKMAKKNKRGFLDKLMMGSEKSEDFARASLPSNRWELFWDIFKGRFWKLVLINLLVLLFTLPLIAMLIFRYVAVINYGMVYPFSQSFGIGYGALPTMVGAAESIEVSVNLTMLLFSPIAFMFLALGLAGGAYVIRNMVWTEGIFVANDFWRGIKKNFKQLLLVMIVYSVVFYLAILSISLCNRSIAYGTSPVWIYKLAKIFSYVLLIAFSVMTLHMITMSVTYKLKFRHLVKNSFKFTIGLLPNNALFCALALIPFLLLLFDGFLMVIGIILLLLFGFSYCLLVWTNYCQWSYDKFINDKVSGAQKRKGMYEKVKADNEGALKKYKEQLALTARSSLNSKPIKPITDDEMTIVELPTSFSRKDIEKLNESKQVLYDDHAKYVEMHMGDEKFKMTEAEQKAEEQRKEREKRIAKAKKELAKRNRNK